MPLPVEEIIQSEDKMILMIVFLYINSAPVGLLILHMYAGFLVNLFLSLFGAVFVIFRQFYPVGFLLFLYFHSFLQLFPKNVVQKQTYMYVQHKNTHLYMSLKHGHFPTKKRSYLGDTSVKTPQHMIIHQCC